MNEYEEKPILPKYRNFLFFVKYVKFKYVF